MTSTWAGGSTLPLTSWRDGGHVYVSATPMPMTAQQARAAAQRLIEHANEIEAADPHAEKVASLGVWEVTHGNGQCMTCNEWEQRRAGHTCIDCENGPGPCTCQLAERPHLMSYEQQLAEAMNGRR